MKISLPEVTLKHGPLSAVEIRLNPKRSVPDPEEDSSPWSRVLSRSKRSLEEPCLNKYVLPTVEFPYQMLDKFFGHVSKLGQNVKLGPKMSLSGEITSKGKEFSTKEKTNQMSGNVESGNTVLSDLPNIDVKMEADRLESRAESDESHNIVLIEEEDKNTSRKLLSSSLVNDSLEWWSSAVKQFMKETFSDLVYSRRLKFLEEKQVVTKDTTRDIELKGDQEETNISINKYVLKVLGEWLQPDTLSIPLARNVSLNLSKLAPVYLDFGFDSYFDVIYTLSRPEVVSKHLKPSSGLEDIWILVNLVHDINTILNIEESSTYKTTESQEESKQDDNVQLKSLDNFTPKSITTAPTSMKVKSIVTNYSNGHDLSVRQERVNDLAPKGDRKTVRAKRSLKWKWPAANMQKEVDDGLDIDPYLTIQVVTKNDSRPTLVKTGYGYFISDHYGVRHPYFNNTKLAQNLLRYNRYQEIKDFVYFGQSLLSNITNMTEDMLEELRLRIDKIMEINRKRKTKLYLEMFENFLSLERAKRQIQTNIPDPGRLGLPPGYQVAHFTDGMPKNITLGNHVEYGGIPNPPLEPSTEYEVVLSVLSSVADVTKHSWISINVTTAARVHKIFSPIFVILSGAFMATCLFICLLGCFVLWCSKGKRKLPFDDDQFDDLRLQLPTDFQTKSPYNMHGDTGAIYRGPQPSTYQRNMYQEQPPPTPGPPPPQYPAFPYSPFLMPPFIPPYNDLPPKSENKAKVVKKAEIEPEEDEDESSGNEGDNIQTTDNSLDEDITLPNYLRKSHKPESHWNRIYDVSSKRFLVEKRENLMDQGLLGPEIKNYMRDKDDDSDGLTFRDEYLSLSMPLQNLSANALTIGTDFSRFPHIHLCEHSRVVLKPDSTSDNTIIHANFIHGFPNQKVSYIAAMSPFNDATVLDFWKMIFQQNIETIVMLTNVVENDIIKCAQYWPNGSDTVSTLGPYLLQTVKEMIYSDFTIRTIRLRRKSDKTSREITQFQYSTWPPHSFPLTPVPLLDMRYKIRSYHQGKGSPILVHCGTGISRTSIFIAADYLIDEYEEEGGISVYTCVNNMRKARPMMVRSLDQYVFIYKIIQEDFEAGDTNFDLEEGLQNTMCHLGQINPKTGRSYIEDQFEILNFFTLDFLCDDLSIARKLDHRSYTVKGNRVKISAGERITMDKFLDLQPVFIDGYRRKNQFVLMNSPTTDESIRMFWKFICKHNIMTIVQLGQEEKSSSTGVVRNQRRRVKTKPQDSKPQYITSTKLSQDKHSKYLTQTTSINRFGDVFMRDLQLEELKKSGRKKVHHIRHFSTPFHHLVCDFSRKENMRGKSGKKVNSRHTQGRVKTVAISSSSALDMSGNKTLTDSQLEVNKADHGPGRQFEAVSKPKRSSRQQLVVNKKHNVLVEQQNIERESFLHAYQLQKENVFDQRNLGIEGSCDNMCETWNYKLQDGKLCKPHDYIYDARYYPIDKTKDSRTERLLKPYVQNKTMYQLVERHGFQAKKQPFETRNMDAASVTTDSNKSDNKCYYVLKDGSLVKSEHYNRGQQFRALYNSNKSCLPRGQQKHQMTNAQRKYSMKHSRTLPNGRGRKLSKRKHRYSYMLDSKHDVVKEFKNYFVPRKDNYPQDAPTEKSFPFFPRKMVERFRNVQRNIICSSRIARKHIKAQPPRFFRARKQFSNYRSALLSRLSTSRLNQSNSAVSPESSRQSFDDPPPMTSLARLNKTRWLPTQLHTHKYSHLRGIVSLHGPVAGLNVVKHQEYSKRWVSASDTAHLQSLPKPVTWQDYSVRHKTVYSESYASSCDSSVVKYNNKLLRSCPGICTDSKNLYLNIKPENCDEKEKFLKGNQLALKIKKNKERNYTDSHTILRSNKKFDRHNCSKKHKLKQCKKTRDLNAVKHDLNGVGTKSTEAITEKSEETVNKYCQGSENINQSSKPANRNSLKKSSFRSPDRCQKALTSGQLLDLIELIWEWQSKPFQVHCKNKDIPPPPHRPILIHCADGTGDANLMCVCALVCERVQEEQEVDVYHTLKHFRRKFPKAIESFAEYEFIHRVLCHYVSEYMDDVTLSNRWNFRGNISTTYQPVIDEAVSSAAHEYDGTYSDNTGNKANSHQSDLDPVTVDELSLMNDSDVSVQRLTLENLTTSKPLSPEAIQHTVRSFIHQSLVKGDTTAKQRNSTSDRRELTSSRTGSCSSSTVGRNKNQSREKVEGKSFDKILGESIEWQTSTQEKTNEQLDAPTHQGLRSSTDLRASHSFNQGCVVSESSVEIEFTKVIHIHPPTSVCGSDLSSDNQHNMPSDHAELVLTDFADSNDDDVMCSAGKSSTDVIQGMERFSYPVMDSKL